MILIRITTVRLTSKDDKNVDSLLKNYQHILYPLQEGKGFFQPLISAGLIRDNFDPFSPDAPTHYLITPNYEIAANICDEISKLDTHPSLNSVCPIVIDKDIQKVTSFLLFFTF